MKSSIFNMIQKVMACKITAYRDMLNCLLSEREALINVEVERLWDVSQKKEKLCRRIESLRKKLSKLIGKNGNGESININNIFPYLTREQGEKIRPYFLTLKRLKEEIKTIREENITVINDSLRFLDDMIAILSTQRRESRLYDEKCRIKSQEQPAILCRRI